MIIGLAGKTNTGKSSFFKAATMIDVEIADRRFVTIKPNVGIAFLIVDCVCKEFGLKCKPKNGKCENGKRFVPVRLVDVAGLVPGAHTGKGLGNKFLDDLRQASALIHIVDFSGLTNEEGEPAVGYDPSFDIEWVEKEIDLWFADVIGRALQKVGKVGSKPELIQILSEQLSGLEISRQHVEEALGKASYTDVQKFATVIRKTSKPVIIAANKIDIKSSQENFEKLKEKFKELIIVPTSADGEIALKKAAEKNLIEYLPGDDFKIIDGTKMNEQQIKVLEKIKKEVIDKFGSTGVQTCLSKAVFELLNYIVVYPVADANKLTDKDGNVLPDVFLVPKGTNVKELAFRVHTELGEKFICGIDARTKRRLAADYQLKNNDVIEIAFAK
jgi:hypothetical protein